MADKHILSLEVPTVANRSILNVKDTSQYTSKLDVDCGELLITPPGYSQPTLMEVKTGFDLSLSACNIGTQTENCNSTTEPMGDGIYIIRYSVAPTSKVYVEYNHLRITTLMTSYYETLCHVDINIVDPHSERKDLIDELKYIRLLMDAAVAKVEYCNSPQQGMALYDYAKKRLAKISCKNGEC